MDLSTSHLNGLTSADVGKRIQEGSTNDAHERTSRSLTDIIRANVLTRFNALIGTLFIIVLAVGSKIDALFIGVIVINSAIGILQEWRAKRTLDRLAILNAPVTHALRDGQLIEIPVREVVLGDVLKLSAGDQVPADGTVLQSEGLEIDESLLTGESEPIVKSADDSVLSGSIVIAGQGFVQITAVGLHSYAHTIIEQVKRFSRTRSELVDGTNRLLGYISWVILISTPFLVWGQITRSGAGLQEALVRSAAAIVGMIPEGLVLLTSLAFMLAALTLARRKVLIQQLPAVEGLARVDIICLDKTGTLTEGRIAFDELIALDKTPQQKVRQVLSSFATEPDSPTLEALHEKFSPHSPLAVHHKVPFSSARKWSAITTDDSTWILGAPEVLIPDLPSHLHEQVTRISHSGKRVILLTRSHLPTSSRHLPPGLQPITLIVLSEKVRSDARETLKFFAQQKVTLKIISGDNPLTVGALARQAGLEFEQPIDARHLPDDPNALADLLERHHIFGRVSPDQKRIMIKALQSRGHVVAMTGDGVNDALALKHADLGIAMGTGAPATRGVADLVLLDDQFSQMPQVLAEGRRIIANIERVANLFLIKNVYTITLAAIVTAAALPYPFLPRHMMILSVLTIGIPSFFLALAPNHRRFVPGFLWRVLRFAVPAGILIAPLIFIAYLLAKNSTGSPVIASTTAAIVIMLIGTWVQVCLARPLQLWKILLVTAMPLIFIALILIPSLSDLLDLQINAPQALWALALATVGAAIIELLWRYTHGSEKKVPGTPHIDTSPDTN